MNIARSFQNLALLICGAVALLASGMSPALAQVPGNVIHHLPAEREIYIGSPSLAVLPDGSYVASHDEFGPKSSEQTSAVTQLFRSSDRGLTWQHLATIQGAFWSTLFLHQGALYLLGTDRHHGDAVIRRSTDGGLSWTSPTNAVTGLLRGTGQSHCAPGPMLLAKGRLWRAMEWRNPPEAWGINYRAGLMSAPADADLLLAANWTFSEPLPSDRQWNGGDMGAWLEGNAVLGPNGQILDVLRVQTRSPDEKAALVQISADGRSSQFDPATGFVDFPGGAKKFTIRFDPGSQLYWSVASIVQEAYRTKEPGSVRNTLALTCSPDLVHWTVRRLLLHHPDIAQHGFQYVDWLFDDEDLIAVCRTAFDDAQGGAHNFHDANFLTFHRIARFRELTNPAPLARAGLHFSFASVRAGRAVLTNRDAFIRSLSPFDRAARMKTDHSVAEVEFLKFVGDNVLSWSPPQTNRLAIALRKVEERVAPWKLPAPATILLVKTSGREEGNACYTRENAIVLPEQEVERSPDLEDTILHELFHVLSRHSPPLRKQLYRMVGFRPINEIALPAELRDRKITNPDGVENGWMINLTNQNQIRAAVPILFASTAHYDVKQGGEFFNFLVFKLLVVGQVNGQWVPQLLADGRAHLLDPQNEPSYFDQIGRNTDYIIHPDEILAVNFVQTARGQSNLPTPRLHAEMRQVLAESARELKLEGPGPVQPKTE